MRRNDESAWISRRWMFAGAGVLALLIGAATAVALAAGAPLRSARPVVIGDPANRMPGTLSTQAISDAHAFKALPVLWLGERSSTR